MHNQTISIGIVDDHILLRKGIAELINEYQNCQVTLEAGNGKELQEILKKGIVPDILLLDLQMPVMNGFQTIEWLHQFHPDLPVIILSVCHYDLTMISLMKKGARAFLNKDIEPKELKAAIEDVIEKGYHYTNTATRKLLSSIHADGNAKYHEQQLNKKELNFLKLASSDLTYKQIAGVMEISQRSVDKIRGQMFQKLDVKSRVGLTIKALSNGIIDLHS